MACFDTRSPIPLLLSLCLDLALLAVLMLPHCDLKTSTHICGCSRYCKRPHPISLATFYRHERYREHDRRESSSIRTISMKLIGYCAHQWCLSCPLVVLEYQNGQLLSLGAAGGPRHCRILRQTGRTFNRNRLTAPLEHKLLMFMHMKPNWPRALVLRKRTRFQIHWSRDLPLHRMWRHQT